MDRVQTLSDKLSQQIRDNASPDQLLMTVRMLQSEIVHLASQQPAVAARAVSVHVPEVYAGKVDITPDSAPASATPAKTPETKEEKIAPEPEEKIFEILEVDEAEVEAELEEIKRNAEERNKISAQNKPRLLFDPVEDTPTLTHQQAAAPQPVPPKELHETIGNNQQNSLNDKLKQQKIELTDSLQEVPLRDLKKGIGVNDRFLFIRELFRGDETMYERSIKTINGFAIFPEAEYWIKRELKLKLGWDDRNEVVRQFDQLVRRRFS